MEFGNQYHEYGLTLAERRLLSDVFHLEEHMSADGEVPEDVLRDVGINIYTGVQEIAMPSAVTETMQPVEQIKNAEGREERVIRWLGQTAIEVAESGARFYSSGAGLARGAIEIAEARHSQESLSSGTAQVLISPKMSRFDASEEVAKREHLFESDSIRVSRPVMDSKGTIVARRMESLLVSDISIDDWVAMLEDEKNVFNQSFKLSNRTSALSVMELFEQMDLPEEWLPEGPVTLVEAVLPYIKDEKARLSVSRQLERFRADQQLYREQARTTAEEWLAFDVELARSLKKGVATYEVERVIVSLQHDWNPDDLQVILAHDYQNGFAMTPKLAAVLERAQQNILGGQAAILTGNEKVLRQMAPQTAQKVNDDLRYAQIVRTIDPAAYALLQIQNRRAIAHANLTVGGGCLGENMARFGGDDSGPYSGSEGEENSSESSAWTWKKGVCRVEACTSPKPTEVGPCSVCRNCQHAFDCGQDPTKFTPTKKTGREKQSSEWLRDLLHNPEGKTANHTEAKWAEKNRSLLKYKAASSGELALSGV